MKDNWRIGERLTINAGVRFERYHLFLPEQSKPAGVFAPAATFPKQEIRKWQGVAPRVAFSYALSKDTKNVVKVTYGRFNYVLDANIGETYNRNALNTWAYAWSDLNGNNDYDPGELGSVQELERRVEPRGQSRSESAEGGGGHGQLRTPT